MGANLTALSILNFGESSSQFGGNFPNDGLANERPTTGPVLQYLLKKIAYIIHF